MSVVGCGTPAEIVRRGPWIKHFPGGQGANNCPRFWYVRDGFGCVYACAYCYLRRFDGRHPRGAEINPDVLGLLGELESWLERPGRLGLILGEVTDAWGWSRTWPRNLQLVERFDAQDRHTLVFLTKSARVHQALACVPPTPRVVLSWSVNSPTAAVTFEMGAQHAQARLEDARRCRALGWRVRLRLDPMVPLPGWQGEYAELAAAIAAAVRPELVTLGSWRPRPVDPMLRDVGAELRGALEPGLDGRLRLRDRAAMYRAAIAGLGTVPVGLCKEEPDVVRALGLERARCNCLGD